MRILSSKWKHIFVHIFQYEVKGSQRLANPYQGVFFWLAPFQESRSCSLSWKQSYTTVLRIPLGIPVSYKDQTLLSKLKWKLRKKCCFFQTLLHWLLSTTYCFFLEENIGSVRIEYRALSLGMLQEKKKIKYTFAWALVSEEPSFGITLSGNISL